MAHSGTASNETGTTVTLAVATCKGNPVSLQAKLEDAKRSQDKPGVSTSAIACRCHEYNERGRVLASLHPLIRLKQTVRSGIPMPATMSQAEPGVYVAHLNPNGAVSVIASDGKPLGVMPEEFEYLAPEEIERILAGPILEIEKALRAVTSEPFVLLRQEDYKRLVGASGTLGEIVATLYVNYVERENEAGVTVLDKRTMPLPFLVSVLNALHGRIKELRGAQPTGPVCLGCAHSVANAPFPGRPSGERPCRFCSRNPTPSPEGPNLWYDRSEPIKVPMDCYCSADMTRQQAAWSEATHARGVCAGRAAEESAHGKLMGQIGAALGIEDATENQERIVPVIQGWAKEIDRLRSRLLCLEGVNPGPPGHVEP